MKKLAKYCLLVLAALILGALGLALLNRPKPLPKALLADGRIVQIEGITFGTTHQIGAGSKTIERFRPWLPPQVRKWCSPECPHSQMKVQEPALVVWVNAIDPKTGQHVDCQLIRVEILSKKGDLFSPARSSSFGFEKFWRVGHVFEAFPRDERTLTMRVRLLYSKDTNAAVEWNFPNPRITRPAPWRGIPLPQHQQLADLEVGLTALVARTNGGPEKPWENPAQYWEPVWELRQAGQPAAGWDDPEWTAEDPTGNRSKFLGLHAPVLRFTATIYPKATNMQTVIVLASSPVSAVADLQSNVWWNTKTTIDSKEIELLGLLPPRTHVFFEGNYETNRSVRMGAVQGGGRSGWTSQSRQVNPMRLETRHAHYTPLPVIYLRGEAPGSNRRLAVRLKDEQGRYWLTKPERQGTRESIEPFLIELPPEVKTIRAEVVLLKPISAEFMVETAKSGIGELRQ